MNRRVALLIGLVVVAVIGLAVLSSRSPVVPDSDVIAAEELLRRTLQDLLAGSSLDDLKTQTLPVYVADELWLSQFQLKEFSIEGPGVVKGTNVCFEVTLIGVDAKNRSLTRDTKYVVTTVPAQTIAKVD